jgi:uncharacterized damage-inducible protein DinB
MPLHDPTDILLAHDRWATHNLLNACAPLTHDQFHTRFDIGLASLHDTARHILGAARGWTDMLNGDMRPGRTPRPRLETEGEKTVEQLIALHAGVADEFEAAARAGSPEDPITGERAGKSYTFPRAAILTHVTTHAMHHRAQCLNMLRRLGVEKLPPVSVMEWVLMVDAGA